MKNKNKKGIKAIVERKKRREREEKKRNQGEQHSLPCHQSP